MLKEKQNRKETRKRQREAKENGQDKDGNNERGAWRK